MTLSPDQGSGPNDFTNQPNSTDDTETNSTSETPANPEQEKTEGEKYVEENFIPQPELSEELSKTVIEICEQKDIDQNTAERIWQLARSGLGPLLYPPKASWLTYAPLVNKAIKELELSEEQYREEKYEQLKSEVDNFFVNMKISITTTDRFVIPVIPGYKKDFLKNIDYVKSTIAKFIDHAEDYAEKWQKVREAYRLGADVLLEKDKAEGNKLYEHFRRNMMENSTGDINVDVEEEIKMARRYQELTGFPWWGWFVSPDLLFLCKEAHDNKIDKNLICQIAYAKVTPDEKQMIDMCHGYHLANPRFASGRMVMDSFPSPSDINKLKEHFFRS
jgi:hypothetical protein